MTQMTLGCLTIDTTDAAALAGWWARATGGTAEDQTGGAAEAFTVVAEGLPVLAFQRVDDPTPGKNKLHMDLGVADAAAAVAELTAIGATVVAERSMGDPAEGVFTWTVLSDPDGNQFCVSAMPED